jgi:hypothetical protein
MDPPSTDYVEMTDIPDLKRTRFQLPKDDGQRMTEKGRPATLSRRETFARKSWRSIKSLYLGARVDTGFNEALFQFGLFTFLFSYIFDNLLVYVIHDRSGWSIFTFTMLQTTGMVTISMADVDINQFLEHNRHQAYAFIVVWVANGAINSATDQYYFVIDIAPALYLLVRSDRVLSMRDG